MKLFAYYLGAKDLLRKEVLNGTFLKKKSLLNSRSKICIVF